MAGMQLRTLVLRATLTLMMLTAAHTVSAQQVTPVPQLKIADVTGTWYEIARLPWKREKKCVSDAFLLIARGQKANSFQVVNSCRIKGGTTDTMNGKGKQVGHAGDGKLKVSYIFPFSTGFWVLALGPSNSWALVGSPNHKNLFLLSKTATLPAEVLTDLQARASAQGFPVNKLIFTPVSGR